MDAVLSAITFKNAMKYEQMDAVLSAITCKKMNDE